MQKTEGRAAELREIDGVSLTITAPVRKGAVDPAGNHVMDFLDRYLLNGAEYYLVSNVVSYTPRSLKQSLTLEDSYTCANGKKLTVTGIRRCKTKTGYVSEKTQYVCMDCKGCPRKAECIRAGTSKTPLEERSKRFEVAKEFQAQRAKALARITSPEGIELRVNRSIQAEGAFAQTKGNLSFRRFLSRGRKNILVEAMLLAMAHNMICLHHKIQAGKEGRYLFPVTVAA